MIELTSDEAEELHSIFGRLPFWSENGNRRDRSPRPSDYVEKECRALLNQLKIREVLNVPDA